jgi:long-subunit acyl-CoA synthetase (AMP-forming)
MTYADVGNAVEAARAGLANLGVQKGDMVAMISRNRLEWMQTAYGGYGLGAVNVPM